MTKNLMGQRCDHPLRRANFKDEQKGNSVTKSVNNKATKATWQIQMNDNQW